MWWNAGAELAGFRLCTHRSNPVLSHVPPSPPGPPARRPALASPTTLKNSVPTHTPAERGSHHRTSLLTLHRLLVTAACRAAGPS
jgi:hypothetical protein